MSVAMASELCFELGDAMVVWWQDWQLLEIANHRCQPESTDTDECSYVCPVNLECTLVECRINQPEHIDDFDENNPHRYAGDHIEVTLGVARQQEEERQEEVAEDQCNREVLPPIVGTFVEPRSFFGDVARPDDQVLGIVQVGPQYGERKRELTQVMQAVNWDFVPE